MKTKHTQKIFTNTLLMAIVSLLPLALGARPSGDIEYGNNTGICPNGYEAGTRTMENCTGSGPDRDKTCRGTKTARGKQGDGIKGKGQKQGNGKAQGRKMGNPNPPDDCPNLNP